MTKGLQVWALFKEELIFDNSYRFILSQHLNHKAYPDCLSKYFTVTIEVILFILANLILRCFHAERFQLVVLNQLVQMMMQISKCKIVKLLWKCIKISFYCIKIKSYKSVTDVKENDFVCLSQIKCNRRANL